jgi:hypothetical protein
MKCRQLPDMRAVLRDAGMACHALGRCRQTGALRFGGVRMTCCTGFPPPRDAYG